MRAQKVDLVVLGAGAHLWWLTGVRPHADERPLLLCVTLSYAGFLMPSLEAENAASHQRFNITPTEGPVPTGELRFFA